MNRKNDIYEHEEYVKKIIEQTYRVKKRRLKKLKHSEIHSKYLIVKLTIKILKALHGFNKNLNNNLKSSDLSADEKWAINYLNKIRIKKIISNNTSLVDIKSKDVVNYFLKHMKSRYEDNMDENDTYFTESMECFRNYMDMIEKKHIEFTLKNPNLKVKSFFSENDNKHNVLNFIKRITFISYFNKIKADFKSNWKTYRENKAQLIVANMHKRLEEINFLNFKKNFNAYADETLVKKLYNSVKLNKAVINLK